MSDKAIENPLFSEQWIEKTNFPVGYTPGQPFPEMRYQYLQDRVFTLQFFPNGSIARGEIEPEHTGFSLSEGEGWYDRTGKFLGDDPNFPEWE